MKKQNLNLSLRMKMTETMKRCVGYGPAGIAPHTEPLSEFTKHRGTKDGLQAICKSCRKHSNIKVHAYSNQKRYGPNADPKYRSSYSVAGARSRAERLLRYPSWITEKQELQIKAIYDIRDKLNKCLNNTYWHVDHVAPLVGQTVSGLHIPENLRLITKEENLSKSNSWDWETQS